MGQVDAQDSLQPQGLFYDGGGWQGSVGSGGGVWQDGKVPCGWAQCDCGWATGDPQHSCGMVDNPHTPCWSCCCSRLYPELYRQAQMAPAWQPGGWFPSGPNGHHRHHHQDDYEDEDYQEDWDDDRDDRDDRDRGNRWVDVGQERFPRDRFREDPYFRDEPYPGGRGYDGG